MALTGKFAFRKTVWGKVVLQIEEETKPFWSKSGALKRRWRDATFMDLAAPEMRHLIDMGHKPWSRPVSPPSPRMGSEPQRAAVTAPVEGAPAASQRGDGQEVRAAH